MHDPVRKVQRQIWRDGRLGDVARQIPKETALALTYNGGTYAVTGTPRDLRDIEVFTHPRRIAAMSNSRSSIVSSPDKLVYMADQIGKFFQTQGSEKAVSGTAEHIKKFWEPRMLKEIFAHLDAGGAGLDPTVRDAINKLRIT